MGLPSRSLPPKLRRLVPRRPGKQSPRTGKAGPKSLENKFDALWTRLGGPALDKELMLIEGRKFRFDRVHSASKVAIELHGGVWTGGRHVRGGGFAKDREKMSLAQELGYLVYELVPQHVTDAQLRRIIKFIKGRTREQGQATLSGATEEGRQEGCTAAQGQKAAARAGDEAY